MLQRGWATFDHSVLCSSSCSGGPPCHCRAAATNPQGYGNLNGDGFGIGWFPPDGTAPSADRTPCVSVWGDKSGASLLVYAMRLLWHAAAPLCLCMPLRRCACACRCAAVHAAAPLLPCSWLAAAFMMCSPATEQVQQQLLSNASPKPVPRPSSLLPLPPFPPLQVFTSITPAWNN